MSPETNPDLQAMLEVFPAHLRDALHSQEQSIDKLLEVVLDLGRRPKAYYGSGEVILTETELEQTDLDSIVENISEFMGDNRAGIERTLHRISCIRNRQSKIIGLTCRVGKAVYGTINIIQDLLESEKSVLLLGRPGVGKTTLLREAARILSESKRVVVVDTSNEIGGDGDIPHPAIGKARRMQVPRPELQHHVMIEAVENHTPQVIIIDEIGRIEEAEAARTIAERGVQLIGTAHGNTLDNLLVNPTLADLVGGIDSVTLSDEEARRRNTQKTVLERRSPPTFDIMVELQDRNTLAVHYDVARAVDSLLRGRPVQAEIRRREATGEISVEMENRTQVQKPNKQRDSRQSSQNKPTTNGHSHSKRTRLELDEDDIQNLEDLEQLAESFEQPLLNPVKAFTYGASPSRLRQTARTLRVPLELVQDLSEADVLITLKSHYRKHPQPIAKAERDNIPLYILRSNTITQMEACLADIFSLSPDQIDPVALAMRETEEAIQRVQRGAKSAELTPQVGYVRRKQHERIREARLISHSLGVEPNRRVKIYRK